MRGHDGPESAVTMGRNTHLPPVLRERCVDIAYRMQCPIDFVAVTTVCMLGSVIGAGCAIRPKQFDDWAEVPNLWGGVVGRPGMLKSPAISEGLKPLRTLEHYANQIHGLALSSYLNKTLKDKFEAELLKKRLTKKASDKDLPESEDFTKLFKLSKQKDTEPILRRYQTNDSTIEKLGESLAGNPRGMLVNRDELIGFLAILEKQGHEGDRTFYLEAWNGKGSYRIDRIGRGEVYVPHLCVSVFGGIQPAKLQEYLLELKALGNDGFVQRFQLFVYPDEMLEFKLVDQAPDADSERQLFDIVEILANMEFHSRGARRDFEEGLPYFRFESEKAQPLFFEWLVGLELQISKEEDAVIAEHRAKFRKLVPALALIFHLFDNASASVAFIPPVSIEKLRMAIAWSEYLLTHARRIYAMGCDFGMSAAVALSKKILSGDVRDGFDERSIYRNGWANLADKESVAAACKELEAAGWIRRKKSQARGLGRSKSPAYDINPKLRE